MDFFVALAIELCFVIYINQLINIAPATTATAFATRHRQSMQPEKAGSINSGMGHERGRPGLGQGMLPKRNHSIMFTSTAPNDTVNGALPSCSAQATAHQGISIPNLRYVVRNPPRKNCVAAE